MSQQCKGTTKTGNRCRNVGDFNNGYCRVHQNQALSKEKQKSEEHKQEKHYKEPESQPLPPSQEPVPATTHEQAGIITAALAAVAGALFVVYLTIMHKKR